MALKVALYSIVIAYRLSLPPRPSQIVSLQFSIIDTLNLAITASSLAHIAYLRSSQQSNLDLIFFLAAVLLACAIGYVAENRKHWRILGQNVFEKEQLRDVEKYVYAFLVLGERIQDDTLRNDVHFGLKVVLDSLEKIKVRNSDMRIMLERLLVAGKN